MGQAASQYVQIYSPVSTAMARLEACTAEDARAAIKILRAELLDKGGPRGSWDNVNWPRLFARLQVAMAADSGPPEVRAIVVRGVRLFTGAPHYVTEDVDREACQRFRDGAQMLYCGLLGALLDDATAVAQEAAETLQALVERALLGSWSRFSSACLACWHRVEAGGKVSRTNVDGVLAAARELVGHEMFHRPTGASACLTHSAARAAILYLLNHLGKEDIVLVEVMEVHIALCVPGEAVTNGAGSDPEQKGFVDAIYLTALRHLQNERGDEEGELAEVSCATIHMVCMLPAWRHVDPRRAVDIVGALMRGHPSGPWRRRMCDLLLSIIHVCGCEESAGDVVDTLTWCLRGCQGAMVPGGIRAPADGYEPEFHDQLWRLLATVVEHARAQAWLSLYEAVVVCLGWDAAFSTGAVHTACVHCAAVLYKIKGMGFLTDLVRMDLFFVSLLLRADSTFPMSAEVMESQRARGLAALRKELDLKAVYQGLDEMNSGGVQWDPFSMMYSGPKGKTLVAVQASQPGSCLPMPSTITSPAGQVSGATPPSAPSRSASRLLSDTGLAGLGVVLGLTPRGSDRHALSEQLHAGVRQASRGLSALMLGLFQDLVDEVSLSEVMLASFGSEVHRVSHPVLTSLFAYSLALSMRNFSLGMKDWKDRTARECRNESDGIRAQLGKHTSTVNRLEGEIKMLREQLERERHARDNIEQSFSCSVCLDTYINRQPMALDCGHVFCGECTRAVRASSGCCPGCRARIRDPRPLHGFG